MLLAACAACAPAPAPPAAVPLAGSEPARKPLFIEAGCGGCHTLAGVPGATGLVGPNLTNIGARPYLVVESIPTSQATLEQWLLDPRSLKADARMPSVGLTQQQARELAILLLEGPSTVR
jgi:cytochrome c